MTWIEVVPPENASGKLKKLYARVAGSDGQVDRILQAHSLRPASLEGHMALYKNVLHHLSNQLPKWKLETLGCYVSLLNNCDYCVAHHAAGLGKLLTPERSEDILAILKAESWHDHLDPQLAVLVDYAQKLTQHPAGMRVEDLEPLRREGLSDGEILEANQVIAYFAYANRTVLGLGVNHIGETLGLSPSKSDKDDWNHQ